MKLVAARKSHEGGFSTTEVYSEEIQQCQQEVLFLLVFPPRWQDLMKATALGSMHCAAITSYDIPDLQTFTASDSVPPLPKPVFLQLPAMCGNISAPVIGSSLHV